MASENNKKIENAVVIALLFVPVEGWRVETVEGPRAFPPWTRLADILGTQAQAGRLPLPVRDPEIVAGKKGVNVRMNSSVGGWQYMLDGVWVGFLDGCRVGREVMAAAGNHASFGERGWFRPEEVLNG